MSMKIPPQLAAGLLAAQGIEPAPGATAASAESASRLLQQSAQAFAELAFECEPSGHAAAQRSRAP